MSVVGNTLPQASSPTAVGAYRSLLVHVESGGLATPRLDVAVSLARRFDATLIGVSAEMLDPMVFSDPQGLAGGDLMVMAQQVLRDDLQRAEALFRTKSAGVTSQWLSVQGVPVEAMALASRAADLIVAGGAPVGRSDKYRTADTAELVLVSGRPVLIAPPQGGRLRGEAVVVAWKDTREARRALSDSLPLLRAAETVVVLEVCEDKREVDGAEGHATAVAEHLRRHGVPASAKVAVAHKSQAAAEILNHARVLDADLVVAGGYGHSRLGEWVFGGVTYDLLHSPEHFVLMSH
jgi:nucleotide-binding universal stress UspA family protein